MKKFQTFPASLFSLQLHTILDIISLQYLHKLMVKNLSLVLLVTFSQLQLVLN